MPLGSAGLLPLPPQRTLGAPSPLELALQIVNPLKRKLVEEEPVLRAGRSLAFSNSSHSDMETYHGHVRTPTDAIILFEACRIGSLPRVQRRLSEKERQSIKSGSVFVWDEREAGMRRWTDGKSWSASRVSGSFLTYREMEGKRGGGSTGGGGNGTSNGGFPPTVAALARTGRTPESAHGSESEVDANAEDGPDGYRYKADGLVKQSFSITTSAGNHLHLISYYSRADPASQQLSSPSTDIKLCHIRPPKGMYPDSTVHEHQNIPAVTRSPMAGCPYTTTPQMAGYARQGPPQWPQQPQPWPAAPASQPPYAQYYGAQYNGQPPHSGVPGPYPPHGPQYGALHPPDRPTYAHDPKIGPPQPDHAAADARRFPPTPPDSRLGPPHAPPAPIDPRMQHSSALYQQPSPYHTAPRDSYPTGPLEHRYQSGAPTKEPIHSSPRSQPPPMHLAPHMAASGPAWAPGSLPRPQSDRSPAPTHPPLQPPTQPLTPIDPQLMGSAQQGPPRDHSSMAHPPPPHVGQRHDGPSGHYTPATGYTPAASTIPSIGALVHGHTPETQRPSHPYVPPASTQSMPSGYPPYTAPKPETTSPSNPAQKEQAPGFVGGKAGFGEDSRTKGLLDKGFKV